MTDQTLATGDDPVRAHRSLWSDVWRQFKVHRGGLAIIAARKITVVGCNNGVGFTCRLSASAPLSNAWTAGVCQHSCTDGF